MPKVNAASMMNDAATLRQMAEELKRIALAMAERLDRAAENKIKRRVHARRLNKELRNGAPAR